METMLRGKLRYRSGNVVLNVTMVVAAIWIINRFLNTIYERIAMSEGY